MFQIVQVLEAAGGLLVLAQVHPGDQVDELSVDLGRDARGMAFRKGNAVNYGIRRRNRQ